MEALFCRSRDGILLRVEGSGSFTIAQCWSDIQRQLSIKDTSISILDSGKEVETTTIMMAGFEESDRPGSYELRIREIYDDDKACYVGVLSRASPFSQNAGSAFRDWFETFLTLESTIRPGAGAELLNNVEARRISEHVTDLFEKTLRNTASVDEWRSFGRNFFFHRVLDFVAVGKLIEFALPAFPCKSPNPRKVGGCRPDMAEFIALRVLRTFVSDVQKLHAPGATLWIISDGHVFSD